MEKLLEDKLLRHYQILKFLIFKNWIPINLVAENLALSERTIQKDLGEINTYIYPAKIETSLKFGIRVYYAHNLNPFYIFSSLLKQSSRFLILEEIFIHSYPNLTSLADKLFISESTLKRKIKKINIILQPYDFSINTTRMDIIGDEKKICWFYYNYILEKYGVLDLVVPDSELELLSQVSQEFFEYFSILKTPNRDTFSYLNHIRIMLFINFKRMQKKHLLEYKGDTKRFKLSTNTSRRIFYHYDVAMDDKAIYRLFYIFFNSLYSWSIDDLTTKIKTNPKAKRLEQALTNCILEIEQAESITITNKDYVLLFLYNSLINTWGSTKILYHPGEEFFMNLNDYYDAFTNRIRKILKKYLSNDNLGIYFDHSVLAQTQFMLVTAWDNLSDLLESNAPTVKVGLFFNTSYEHTQFLLQDISYHLKSRLEIEVIEAKTIYEVKNKYQDLDMIITNLSALTLPKCSIVSIHANPTVDDFVTILTQYNKIVNNKIDADIHLVKKANSIFL